MNAPSEVTKPEPWLRGKLTDVPAVPRAVLHALQLAGEDIGKWCGSLTGDELNARPSNLPSVAFQLRHVARSLDRLLTYAEGRSLSNDQRNALGKRNRSRTHRRQRSSLSLRRRSSSAVSGFERLANADLEQARTVGKKALPTTLGGLLVHVADHTQRHVGQAITTAKIILAQR